MEYCIHYIAACAAWLWIGCVYFELVELVDSVEFTMCAIIVSLCLCFCLCLCLTRSFFNCVCKSMFSIKLQNWDTMRTIVQILRTTPYNGHIKNAKPKQTSEKLYHIKKINSTTNFRLWQENVDDTDNHNNNNNK